MVGGNKLLSSPEIRRSRLIKPDRGFRIFAALPILATSLGISLAQPIPPGEIHSRTAAYAPPPELVLHSDVRMVEVPVVVRDSRRHAVGGLTRDDFEIYDEGKKQPITAFSVEHAVPRQTGRGTEPGEPTRNRFVTLCFDDVHLAPAFAALTKDAAKRFVSSGLTAGDRVAVVRTSQSGKTAFTNNVPALIAEIDKVGPFLAASADDLQRCPAHFEPYEAYQIAEQRDPGDAILKRKLAECAACFHDCPDGLVTSAARSVWEHTRLHTSNMLGALESVVDGMTNLPGQRFILLASGGFLSAPFQDELDRIMEKARRAGVMIHELDARGLPVSSRTISVFDALGSLASGTGGMFFHNNNDLALGFQELGGAPETSYVLGFAGAADGRFHKLKVKLSEARGFEVEARLGYAGSGKVVDVTNSTISRLDAAVMAADTVEDLPVTFTWDQGTGRPEVSMVAHLDIARLRFVPNGNRRVHRLAIVAAVMDQDGKFIAGKCSVLELDFTDRTFARFEKTGFTAALTIPVPRGNYVVRAVAQDGVEGKLAAASSRIEIK
jgi:VWFA-related protein